MKSLVKELIVRYSKSNESLIDKYTLWNELTWSLKLKKRGKMHWMKYGWWVASKMTTSLFNTRKLFLTMSQSHFALSWIMLKMVTLFHWLSKVNKMVRKFLKKSYGTSLYKLLKDWKHYIQRALYIVMSNQLIYSCTRTIV